jgi:hypothetical protein
MTGVVELLWRRRRRRSDERSVAKWGLRAATTISSTSCTGTTMLPAHEDSGMGNIQYSTPTAARAKVR